MGLFAGTKWDVAATCDRCGRLETECNCPAPPPVLTPPEKQILRIRTEKRKAGRVVTLVTGVANESDVLPQLLTKLKNACGAGGTIEDDVLVLQGDHQDKLSGMLTQLGYRLSKK